MTRPQITIVAGIIRDRAGRILLVRKAGTRFFIQPGGKREPGEDDRAALAREITEELGCAVVAGSLVPVGHFRAAAANEMGSDVDAAVYMVQIDGQPAPRAEIAELLWIDPRRPPDIEIAPLTRDHVLPFALALPTQ